MAAAQVECFFDIIPGGLADHREEFASINRAVKLWTDHRQDSIKIQQGDRNEYSATAS